MMQETYHQHTLRSTDFRLFYAFDVMFGSSIH